MNLLLPTISRNKFYFNWMNTFTVNCVDLGKTELVEFDAIVALGCTALTDHS